MGKTYQARQELPIPAGQCDPGGVKRSQLLGRIWVLGIVPVLGCKASVQADAKTSFEVAAAEEKADTPDDSGEPESSGDAPGEAASDLALAGARPDLGLGNERAATACHCLAVAAGQPNDPIFVWQAGPPTTDPGTQTVIALSSAGSSCGGPGASYWGHRLQGDNVVVVVENARPGRPLIQGAIVPRPRGAGRIEVVPLTKQVPYARAVEGSGPCVVKFPPQH